MRPRVPRQRATLCSKCGERLQRTAPRCKHCGARQTTGWRPSVFVAAGVGVALLALVIVLLTLDPSSGSNTAGPEADPQEPTLEVLRITQRKLRRDVRYWRELEDGYRRLHQKDPGDSEIERALADAVGKREDGERKLEQVEMQISARGETP